MPGQIYLVQPTTLINTKRFKVGYSRKSNLNRLKFYGKGVRCIRVIECNNPKTVEKKLIKSFKKKFKLVENTNEYFEIEGDEKEMINLFDSITRDTATKKKETSEEDIQLNNQISIALQREKILNKQALPYINLYKKNMQTRTQNLDTLPYVNPYENYKKYGKNPNPFDITNYK